MAVLFDTAGNMTLWHGSVRLAQACCVVAKAPAPIEIIANVKEKLLINRGSMVRSPVTLEFRWQYFRDEKTRFS